MSQNKQTTVAKPFVIDFGLDLYARIVLEKEPHKEKEIIWKAFYLKIYFIFQTQSYFKYICGLQVIRFLNTFD